MPHPRSFFSSLKLPIIAAPMAGGASTPGLAAAVANWGCIGSFGFAHSSPDEIEASLVAATRVTSGPLNANFFIFPEYINKPSKQLLRKSLSALKSLPLAADVDHIVPDALPYYPDLERMLEPVWELRPAVVSFHFGLPSSRHLRIAKECGILVGVTATSAEEGRQIQLCGADFIVAQGIEAGGHRGKFNQRGIAAVPDEKQPLLQLLRELAADPIIEIPVVAAGGIMDGYDVHRAVHEYGAAAVQMGTAFLVCDESGASAAAKRCGADMPERGTRLTRIFSGREARGVQNEFMTRMEEFGKQQSPPLQSIEEYTLPFPLQNTLTARLRARAVELDNGEYQSLWAGSEYQRARAMPAAALLDAIHAEYRSCEEHQ